MQEIAQIKKLSLWIFFVPLVGINFCLFISVNYSFFENTIFVVDQIGRSGFSIPYFDGSLSISRASRTFPQYLVFKPTMIITGVLLILYWNKTNILVNKFRNSINQNNNFKYFGVVSAVLLIIHSIFLGIEIDIKFVKLFKRLVLLGFIICELIAQGFLVKNFYAIKSLIKGFYNPKILTLKIILVSLLILIAIVVSPILSNNDYVHLKHGLEWNYFIGIILFYFLTSLFWRRTT